jgi:hypothetical protein
MAQAFDWRGGNLVKLEHVNLHIPDQRLATLFYVVGLGLTRDPYLMTGVDNMWVNVGANQLHLQTGAPMVLRGRIGMVTPDLDLLAERLRGVAEQLTGTKFAVSRRNDAVEATCPWGNRYVCHPPAPRFGRITLGVPYVELDVPSGSAAGIARFYREVMDTAATITDGAAHIAAGPHQELIFRETSRAIPAYDGHHLQVYVADFSGPHDRLAALGLITEESDAHQYRFTDIVELDTRRTLTTIEHEVRSLRHPLYQRPLVNRNPTQTNFAYAPGQDDATWTIA